VFEVVNPELSKIVMNQLPVELGQAVKQAFAANAHLSAFTSLAAKAG